MWNFIKKHNGFIIFLFLIVLLTSIYYNISVLSGVKYNGYTIVVDAGHGGRDGGSVGVNGSIEKEINLEYANTLKDVLVKNGFRVVMTRKTDDGLYSALDKNKKLSDMNRRFSIIKRTNPNLVISIHMNSFSNPIARGANSYYRKGDSASKLCADYIQKSFHAYCDASQTSSKVGDYYMLNCSYYTAVLIECGFLSNPDEERLLLSKAYRDKIIDSIYKGVLLYFGNVNI